MLDDQYLPEKFEDTLYKEMCNFFNVKREINKKPYTIMMPPPNITGSLHLGHALTYTLQDVLVRFKRQCGKDVLWQPGTDHAGIATQMIVERQLEESGLTRQGIGREVFLEEVWKWRQKSGDNIVKQQRHLGISPNWERSCFTMDPSLSRAVTKAFVTLYNDGLIYRAKRLVNWDCKLKTALSDLEVINKEEKGFMYFIRYPFSHNPTEGLTIATTRPETLFGDTAIIVHPQDKRYQPYIGKKVKLPLTNREIFVIADEHSDPEKGTGVVKITPAHDFNDFNVGTRHNLESISIFTEDGFLNENVPSSFQGLQIKEARDKVIKTLEQEGLLIKIEPHTLMIPYSDRSGEEIQPLVTNQWFLDAKILAEPALKAVEEGHVSFIPKQWENTYFEWLRNIQPWCISRQIWWGHILPVWYGPDHTIFVEETEELAYKKALNHYGHKVTLKRETDVLDTWFSSALWPFSTLGWPDQTPELSRYYPTDILVTGFDIIFFWVARMMMMGFYFMKAPPFHTIYIHALVRDEKGQKMSKTKGNVIDPLDLAKDYGTDALRFTLLSMASPGRDIKLGLSSIELSRNFITKIWNCGKFLELKGCVYNPSFNFKEAQHPLNRWIIRELITLTGIVSENLELYRFDWACQAIQKFFRNAFCDFYVETLKVLLNEENHNSDIVSETKEASLWVFMEFLKITQCFMPFVTEKLWREFYPKAPNLLFLTPWPSYNFKEDDFLKEKKEIEECIEIIEEVRSLRGIVGISPALKIGFFSEGPSTPLIKKHWGWISFLARLSSFQKEETPTFCFSFKENLIELQIQESVNKDEIKDILSKKGKKLEHEILHLSKKLENSIYKKAKPDQWKEDETLHQEKEKALARLIQLISLNK